MESTDITQYADMLSAMGSEPRLAVLRLLLKAAPDGMSVGDIQKATGIANSTLSHHLDKLKRENLISSQKDKQWIWYSANLDTLGKLIEFIYADCCGGTKKLTLPKGGRS